MCACIYIRMRVCVNACVCVCMWGMYIRIPLCVYVRVRTGNCLHVRVYVNICMFILHPYLCACINAYIRVRVQIFLYLLTTLVTRRFN